MSTTSDQNNSRDMAAVRRQNSNKRDGTGRLQPMVAFRALKQLIANPEDTAKVFVILEALTGDALLRGYRRFRNTPVGLRVAEQARQDDQPLLDVLRDREALRSMPAGSLGRTYLNFVETEQITADGLVEASEADERFSDPGLQQYAERLRDMHDLWHVTTRYGRDTFGEVCLLAFTYAQTRNRGIGVIALVGAFKTQKELGRGVWRAVFRGFNDGRKAAWLPAADWEALLARPLDEVRETLRVAAPTPYQAIWAEHRAVSAAG
ncbi:MAG: Coq4 family protein [Pseudomonadales bacterium]